MHELGSELLLDSYDHSGKGFPRLMAEGFNPSCFSKSQIATIGYKLIANAGRLDFVDAWLNEFERQSSH